MTAHACFFYVFRWESLLLQLKELGLVWKLGFQPAETKQIYRTGEDHIAIQDSLGGKDGYSRRHC